MLNNSNQRVFELCSNLSKPESEFPKDVFTIEQRKNGAIVLHILAALYVLGKLNI